MTLANGTAHIEIRDNMVILTYMTMTNFTYGEQRFGRREDAVSFCIERGLRLLIQ